MATSEPEQPNLSEAAGARRPSPARCAELPRGLPPHRAGRTTWKAEDGNGHAISDMFRLLRVEPLAVALVLSEMLNGMIDAGDEPNPLSYGAGFIGRPGRRASTSRLRGRNASERRVEPEVEGSHPGRDNTCVNQWLHIEGPRRKVRGCPNRALRRTSRCVTGRTRARSARSPRRRPTTPRRRSRRPRRATPRRSRPSTRRAGRTAPPASPRRRRRPRRRRPKAKPKPKAQAKPPAKAKPKPKAAKKGSGKTETLADKHAKAGEKVAGRGQGRVGEGQEGRQGHAGAQARRRPRPALGGTRRRRSRPGAACPRTGR